MLKAVLDNSFPEDFISVGGVRVESATSVKMIGNVQKLYKLTSPVRVDKYSILEIKLEYIKQMQTIGICLYESESEVTGSESLFEDESRCHNFVENGTIRIQIGALFGFRITEVHYLHLFQEDPNPLQGVSILSGFIFSTDGLEENYDDSAEDCESLDANSVAITNGFDVSIIHGVSNERKCVCRDGFVASTGGNILGKYDSCVKMLSQGLFDASPCTYSRECISGLCFGGICTLVTNLGLRVTTSSTDGIIQGSMYSHSAGVDGGVALQPDNSINLYGTASVIYKLSDAVTVNKYTDLHVDAISVGQGISIKICLLTTDDFNTIQYCPSFCYSANEGSMSIDTAVNVGEMVGDRMVQISHVGFLQTSHASDHSPNIDDNKTSIQNVGLLERDGDKNITDAKGKCKDPNSRILRDPSRIIGDRCSCFDGFVSSNGGKNQGIFDTCISCLPGTGPSTSASSSCFLTKHDDVCTKVR